MCLRLTIADCIVISPYGRTSVVCMYVCMYVCVCVCVRAFVRSYVYIRFTKSRGYWDSKNYRKIISIL